MHDEHAIFLFEFFSTSQLTSEIVETYNCHRISVHVLIIYRLFKRCSQFTDCRVNYYHFHRDPRKDDKPARFNNILHRPMQASQLSQPLLAATSYKSVFMCMWDIKRGIEREREREREEQRVYSTCIACKSPYASWLCQWGQIVWITLFLSTGCPRIFKWFIEYWSDNSVSIIN